MDTIMSKKFHCNEHWAKQIELCLRIAMKAHAGQIDKVGLPVILHPLHVGDMGETPIEVCVGFLHDSIEDADVTAESLLAAEVDKEIVDAVCLLTHDKSVPYMDYIQSLIDTDNRTAIRVKYNDLYHNFDRSETYGFKKQYLKYKNAISLIETSCTWMNILDGVDTIPDHIWFGDELKEL